MPFVPDPQTQPAGRFVPDSTAPAKKPLTYGQSMDALIQGMGQAFPVSTGIGETAAQMTSGAVAAPAAGLTGAASLPAGLNKAVDNTQAVNEALTYQPRTPLGKVGSTIASAPFAAVGKGADVAGGKVAEVTGSPALGALTNAGTQFLPALLMRGARGAPAADASATMSGEAALARAQEYVARNTSLDWNSLSQAIRTRLADIARDSTSLDRLDSTALERQARLESLRVPVQATRAQLTRNPAELSVEGTLADSTANNPVRTMRDAQSPALIQNLEALQTRTRGQATTSEQVGQSVQGAARGKLQAQQAQVRDLYRQAEAAGELQGSVSVDPVKDVIASSPDLTHLGWVQTWLDKLKVTNTEKTGGTTVESTRPVSLKELEDLRQAAVARAMDGGTEGYYAGKVIRAIDQSTEGAGGQAYQAARAARRQQALEFEDQGGVANLVDNRSRTDRAVALEDTWRKSVIGGSIQDLRNVKQSLLTGGTQATRAAGKQAWRDMRAQTLQYVIDESTKSTAALPDGSRPVSAAGMQKALRAIGPEKLEEVFGPGTVRELNQIMQATTDVRTEPARVHPGASTLANVVAFLEKNLGRVPVVGDMGAGIIRGGVKLNEMGRTARAERQAQTNPLDDAVTENMTAAQRREAIARAMRVAPVTQENQAGGGGGF